MHRIRLMPLAFICALLLQACSSRTAPGGPHRFATSIEEGVPAAISNGPRYETPLFDYEESLRLTQDESRAESLLSRPTVFLMDEQGRFFVEDNRPDRIVCFDSVGNYSHEIGETGEGPGEYSSPSLQSVGDGIVTIHDSRLQRVSFFRTDGTFVDSKPLYRGDLFVQRTLPGPDGDLILLGTYDEGFMNQFRYSWAGALVLSAAGDTLASIASDRIRQMFMVYLEQFRLGGSAMIHYNGWPQALYHPVHGLILSTGVEPVYRCYGLDGQLRRLIRLDMPPEPVSDAERDAVLANLRGRVQEARDDRSRAIAQAYVEHVEFQDPKAYWWVSQVDDDGYLWAHQPNNMFAPPLDEPVITVWRVFSPDGEYLGDTQSPVPEGYVSRGHLLTIQEDEETGAMELIVYRIRSRVPGFVYP